MERGSPVALAGWLWQQLNVVGGLSPGMVLVAGSQGDEEADLGQC